MMKGVFLYWAGKCEHDEFDGSPSLSFCQPIGCIAYMQGSLKHPTATVYLELLSPRKLRRSHPDVTPLQRICA